MTLTTLSIWGSAELGTVHVRNFFGAQVFKYLHFLGAQVGALFSHLGVQVVKWVWNWVRKFTFLG